MPNVRRNHWARNALIAAPLALLTLAFLLLCALVGFVGLRSTEILERAHVSSVAREFTPYPGSVLVAEGYKNMSWYPSLYPRFHRDCVTWVAYYQIYHSDEPLDRIVAYAAEEFEDLGWSVTSSDQTGVSAQVAQRTGIGVGRTHPMVTEMFPGLNLQALESAYETVYTVSVAYSTQTCFELP